MSQENKASVLLHELADRPLNLEDLAHHPMVQFRYWFQDATDTGVAMPEAMSVATSTPEGLPSLRVVLCKAFDETGFVFYTNYQSTKAQKLEENPRAALLFHWKLLERQVRIVGKVERVSRDVTEAYFQTRPRGSQISAWASPQSREIAGRLELEQQHAEIEERFAGQDIPAPPFWGGYLIRPSAIEFWQGRSNRLHDRFLYTQNPDGTWTIKRLAP